MKKILFLCGCLGLLLSGQAFAQDSDTKIRLKVTDAEGNVIEKEYESEEAMQNDPELEELGIEVEVEGSNLSVRSQGEGNQVFIFKGKGEGEPGKLEFSFDVEQARMKKDSLWAAMRERWDEETYEHRRRRHGRHYENMDSLREARREAFMKRDSLRQERRAAMRAGLEEEIEAMKQQMQELRQEVQRLRGERGENTNQGNRALIIQELSPRQVQEMELEGPEERLELDDFRLFPDPAQGTITIELQAPEEGDVRLKLLDEEGRHVYYDETHSLEDGFLQQTIEVGQPDPGIYTLQIIQDGKAVNHRVIIR